MPGENQDVPRSGARPAAPQLAHNSVRAPSATCWRPTPPAPTGGPQKLLYSFFTSGASSDDGPACRNSNLDSGKTRCVTCRYSQTPPRTSDLGRPDSKPAALREFPPARLGSFLGFVALNYQLT